MKTVFAAIFVALTLYVSAITPTDSNGLSGEQILQKVAGQAGPRLV